MKKKLSFSLITFVYNEEELLENQIRKWVEQFQRVLDDFEIILVNDGSIDSTGEIADRLTCEFPQLKVLHHPENRGVGYACRTARQYVTKDYVFWNDIDGHFNLDDLEKVVPFLNNYDIVVGFKHDISKIAKKTSFSWIKSQVNYYLIKLLFLSPIKDFQFVQFFPREFFCEGMVLESYSSFVPAECLVKARYLGLEIIQRQLHYYPRRSYISRSNNFKTIMTSVRNIFSFWFRWVFFGAKRKTRQHWFNRFGDKRPWRK